MLSTGCSGSQHDRGNTPKSASRSRSRVWPIPFLLRPTKLLRCSFPRFVTDHLAGRVGLVNLFPCQRLYMHLLASVNSVLVFLVLRLADLASSFLRFFFSFNCILDHLLSTQDRCTVSPLTPTPCDVGGKYFEHIYTSAPSSAAPSVATFNLPECRKRRPLHFSTSISRRN